MLVDPTTGGQHPKETVKVTRRRDELGVADVEWRWTGIEATARWLHFDEAVPAVSVGSGQPIELLRRHPQGCIGHPERCEQVVGQVIVERPAGQSRDQDAQQAERVVVAPSLAGLERERQGREPRVLPEVLKRSIVIDALAS